MTAATDSLTQTAKKSGRGTLRHLAEVFRFELAYQLRRVSTRVYFAIFFGFALTLTYAIFLDAREDGYFFNAPIVTSLITIIAGMLSLFVTAGIAGDAATRDTEVRIDPLLYVTPLTKPAYLGGRFLGSFAVMALLLVAVPLGLLLSTALPLGPEIVGPFRGEAYLTAYFVFALPNAFVATAILFAIAALSRRAVVAYAGAAFLFFSTFIAQGFIASRIGARELAKLLDALGYTALRSLWTSYNPIQKNTLLVGIDGLLLANRLLWLGIAFAVLGVAFVRFRFAHQTAGRGWRRRAAPDADPALEARWLRVAIPAARRTFGIQTRVRQLRAITTRSLRALVASRGWLIVPLVAALFVMNAGELLEVQLGTPGAATSARIAAILGVSENALLIALLVALSAGMLVWRERDARVHSIADVAPVPEWLTVTGNFLAIALMLVLTELIFVVTGAGVQMVYGASEIDLGIYFKFLFGQQLAAFLLFAAVAMAVHVVVDHKYVGNLLAMLVWVGTTMARELGVEHHLLLYGRAPKWWYSEMAGFGPELTAWRWFTFYWSGWALLFAVLAFLFWIRGEDRGLRRRIAIARRRLTPWSAALGAAALAIIAGAGGFVFYNTNMLNRYYTDAEIDARRAEYERRYGKYATLPQPALAATKLHVDFHPERRSASIRGTYRLENRTGAAVDAIHLVTHTGVETSGVSFDRPSRAVLIDEDLGYRIYALEKPLSPGESLQMNFRIVHAPRGFTNAGGDSTIMPGASWIEHRGQQAQRQRQWFPVVGYERVRELSNAGARARHGLPARRAVPSLDDVAARRARKGVEKIDFEAIVATDAGRTGVAPGVLRRRWTENGRSYAHYVTDAPITNGYAIYSADYSVHRAQWQPSAGSGRPVAIEIYHHPAHTRNLERMVRSARASLEYHTRHYGPYPYSVLRMIESPSPAGSLSLTAHTAMIRFSEGYALARPDDDRRGIDLPFAVMAHEIAHQWWGHQLVPAAVEGAALLSESLAWYSAMLVVEETYGREHLNRLLDLMRSQYLAPHATRAVPLLRASDQLDAYRTGPFAMYAIRELAGAERINGALRNLLGRFDPARPPYPTSLDLYAALHEVTPPEMHYLLKDLFEEVTFWDVRTKKAEAQPAGSGAWRITVQIDAHKIKSDPLGREKRVPMNDLVELALFDENEKPLYRASHRIRAGEQTITLTVPRRPTRAAIDPDHALLDRKPEDNEVQVGAP